jgi:hypothetical protein
MTRRAGRQCVPAVCSDAVFTCKATDGCENEAAQNSTTAASQIFKNTLNYKFYKFFLVCAVVLLLLALLAGHGAYCCFVS